MRVRRIVAGFILLTAPFAVALAQEEAQLELGSETTEPIAAPPNTVSCFDYYSFGSVQANLMSSVSRTVSGAPITFSGTLENSNPYPVVDGVLMVKIFRTRTSEKNINGPDVVDQFVAASDIVIPANGKTPVSFSWRVPTNAKSGEYQLATFFTTSRKSNLLGLSFTDDVVGNMVSFGVSGERQSGVQFDKEEVSVNNEPYYFASSPPLTSTNDPVVVQALVRNTTDAAQKAQISWSIYQWDAQLRENVVQEENQSVTIPARGSLPVSITVKDTLYPVYLALGTLTWNDTKSIIGVRFVRPNVQRARINFPSILFFPLVRGEENTVFSCLHNSGDGAVLSGGRMELTLTDMEGNLIHEYVYEGDITGAMMGVMEKFIPEKSYNQFRLDARLFQNGEFVDEASLVYDCNEIDPASCRAESDAPSRNFSDPFAFMIYLVLGLGVLLVGFMLRRGTRRRNNTLPPI